MNKFELIQEFENLSSRAIAYNRSNKNRRFYPISQAKYGKTTTIGMYDYKSKKYALVNVKSIHLERTINEIKTMLTQS